MALLHLEPLPARTTKGEILSFLCGAGIDGKRVGRIDLRGATAVVEVPDGWESRLVKALDGAAFKNRRLRAWAGTPAERSDDGDHFQRLARLLELESRAEAEQARSRAASLSPADAERTGECLVDLVVAEEASGLGGRCLVTLAKRNRAAPLPWTRLQVGSPVLVVPEGGSEGSGARGVVCARGERTLCVAVAEPP